MNASSATSFSVKLNAADQAALNASMPENGNFRSIYFNDFYLGSYYNLSAAANWDSSAASSADLGIGANANVNGNLILVSKVGMAPATATKLLFSMAPNYVTSGMSGLSASVRAVDASGKVVPTFSGNITLSLASGAGQLTGKSLALTAVNGVASFSGLTYTATADQQAFTVTASASGLTAATSANVLSNVSASKLEFSVQPAATLASGTDSSFSTVPVVRAVDANGTLDTGFNGAVTLKLNGQGNVTTLSATGDTDTGTDSVTVNAVNGVATFTGLSLNYSNSASSDSVTLLASASLTSGTTSVPLQSATSSALTSIAANTNTPATLSDIYADASAALAVKTGVGTSLDFIKVSDPDSANTISVTVSATGGSINGLVDADSGTAGIQISGSVSDVNTLLAKAQLVASSAGATTITVTASDGVTGSDVANATYYVSASNAAPAFSSVSTLSGGKEDGAYSLGFADLLKASNAVDPGGSVEAFVVKGVTTGTTLSINGNAWAASSNDVIKTGDTVLWTPASNANGSALEAFSVVARDNLLALSETQVPVNVALAAVNDAPTLSGSYTFAGLQASAIAPTGVTVASLLNTSSATTSSDVDTGAAPVGIAITGSVGKGTWQISADSTNGTNGTWSALGAVSDAGAKLLAASNYVRYLPDGESGESGSSAASLTYRASDGTSGASGTADTTLNGGSSAFSSTAVTAPLTVTAVTKPLDLTLTSGAATQSYAQTTPVALDPTLVLSGNKAPLAGAKVMINGGLVTAEDRLTIKGLTGSTSGNVTTYQNIVGDIDAAYDSTTGVMSLSSTAPVADYQDALRLVSYQNIGNNAHTAPRTIDISAGTMLQFTISGAPHFYEYVSGDVTWTAARDGAAARVYAGMTGYLATITSAEENSYIASRLSSNGWIGAQDASAEGVWQWATGPEAGTQFSNGTNPTAVGGMYANWASGEPNNYGGVENYAQMRADTGKWNDVKLDSPTSTPLDTNRPRGYLVEYSSPSVTSVSFAKTITLTPQTLNHAPVLASATPTLTGITEDTTDNAGQLVSAIVNVSTVTDADSGASIGGIAITALETGNGTWQYRLANTGAWQNVGSVSDSSALLLRPTDGLRFVPDAKNATMGSFTYHAWDQTSGTAGATVDASATGNASAFSTASNTATISVTAVNDAPTLTSATLDFAGITEDDTGNAGQSVAKLLGGSFRDADLGTSAGAAITGKTVVGTGSWEYSTDSGSNWTALGTVSESSALLLAGSDLVRFKPDGLLGGTPTLTLRGWDGSNGTVHTPVNIAATGDTTAFSTTSATASISVKSINDAPAAAASSGSAAYTEHGTATALDAALTLTDDGTIAAASVRISSGFSAGDALNFSTQSGITGSYDAATGVLKLSGSATPAQYQTALQSVTFSSSSDDPTQLSASRTLEFTTTDSDGLGSAAVTRGLAITPVANAPTLANAPGSGWVYTQYDGARVLAPELALADLDDTQMSGATVTLSPASTGFSSSAEQLGLVKTSAMSAQSGDWTASISGVSLTYTATTGVLALSGTADKAVYQDILRSVTYANSGTGSIDSSNNSRSIAWSITDANSDSAGAQTSASSSTGLTLKYANAAPKVSGADVVAAYTENAANATVLANAVVPADYTGGTISKATVKVDQGFTKGDVLAMSAAVTGISASFESTTGVLTLSGSASTADYQTALRSVNFSSSSDDPTASATSRSIHWQVYDANDVASKNDTGSTTTLNITAVNDKPTLIDLPASGNVKYTEGSGAVRVASSVTLSDADDHLFSQVTVTLGGSGLVATKEFLGIEGQTPGTGSMAANSNWSIANINSSSGVAASYVASTGVLTLSSTNPVEGKVYQSILNLLTYNSTDTDPTITASPRSLTWQVTDGNSDGVGAQTSTAQTSAITLVPVNNAPTLGGLTATVSHTEANSSNVGSGLTLSDADDASIAGATVQIAKGRSAGDVLAFTAGNGIMGSYSSETGVLSLTGTASVANYVTALQSVTFNTGTDPTATNASRTLVWSVTDANSDGAGAASSVQARQTVNVTATANAPVVTPGTTGKFTKGDAPVAINAALTLSDADDAYIAGATVTISNGKTASDVLALPAKFASLADISGSYNATSGVLTLTGTATVAQYQEALQAVTFTNSNPANSSRTLTWAVTDANSDGVGAQTGSNTSTISVGTVNAAPVLRAGGELSYTEGGSAAVIDSTLTLKDDDANMSGATVRVTSGLTSGDVLAFTAGSTGITGSYSNGVLTLSGSATVANYMTALRTVSFANSSDDPTASGTATGRTITWNVTDGNSVAKTSSDVTGSITVKAVNDAPVIGGTLPTSSNTTFTQGSTSVAIGTGITISDADDTQISGATVRISNYITPGDALSFTAANGITGEYDGYSGVLKLSGNATLADYQTALQSVKFSNDSTSPTYGSATSRTFSWSVIDANSDGAGAQASTAVTSSTAVAAVNRAPFISLRDSISNENFTSGPTGINPYGSDKVGAYRLGDQGANLVRDIMVEDRDSTALSGATVSISGGTLKTGDTLSFTNQNGISGSYNSTTGVLTLTSDTGASPAPGQYAYQQALRSVTFSNVTNDAAHAGDRSISWTVSDNASTPAISDAATTTLKVSVATPPPSVAFNAISVDNRLNGSDVGSALTITGSSAFAENGQSVTVYLNGQSYYGAISNNAWSVSVPHAALQALPNGGVLLSANVMNTGGYIAPTASAELQIDTTAPIIKLDAVMVDNRINLSESNAGITVSGTTDAEPGQWLTISLGDSSQTVQVQELSTVSDQPTWSASFSGTSVSSDGTLRLVALVKDQAGNAGELNTLVEVDRVAPTLSINSLVMNYGATSSPSDDSAVISGTTDADIGQELSLQLGSSNQTVTIDNSLELSGTSRSWSVTVGANVLSGHAGGTLSVAGQVSDPAGNVTQLSRALDVPSPAPTLSSYDGTLGTVNEDTQAEITLASLKSQGNEADIDGTVDAFVVKAVSTGTLRIGSSAGSASAWAAGSNDTVDASHNAYWTGAQDANGTLNAFTAVAKDNSGNESATAVQARMSVTPVNDPAVISGASTASLSESNAVLTASGTLVATDVDSAATFVAQTNVAGDHSYGKFSIGTNGAWTYTTSSAHDEFLTGRNYSDSITVAMADGTTQTLRVSIAGSNDAPTGSVSISGNAIESQTLSASDSLADPDGLEGVSYEWYANGVAVGGGASHTLSKSEVGKTISVLASYVDAGGTRESVSSAATEAVAALVDGAAVVIHSTTQGGQTTTTQTVDPVAKTRSDDTSTVNTTLADIPLASDSAGVAVVQVSLPVGVGLTSSATVTAAGATALTLREQLIAASNPRVGDATQMTQIINNGIDQYVPGVTDSSQVTVRTITLTVAAGTTTAPTEAIHIAGALGTGEGDASHPLRQEALVIDASHLPSGTVLDLDNVEFAIIIGPVTACGGAGRNYVIGDGSAQTIILGADDDILHGGAGNDVVGSKGGNDQLFGDEGNDTVVGGLGDDHLEGGAGDDLLMGGQSDAGLLSFSQLKNQLTMNWTPGSTELADSTGWSNTGNHDGGTPIDPRLAFMYQSTEMRETVTELYHLLLNKLPTMQEMNFWATSGYSVAQLEQGAANLLLKYVLDIPTQYQVKFVMEQLWGAGNVTNEQILSNTNLIIAGGSWGQLVDALIKSQNFKVSLLNADGSMTLTQVSSMADSGWAFDTAADTLLGGAGNDTLIGGRGSDLLDGGDGADSALWYGQAANFEVRIVTTGTTKDVALLDTSSGEVDIIRNIEQLQIGGVSFDSTKLESLANVEAYLATHTDHHLEIVLVGLAH
ncbi:MAG: VCBS domain-containing protein [Burkholderiales bacterium]|nr:VCBS domain-containing protein [Burkholderiales bacterium]